MNWRDQFWSHQAQRYTLGEKLSPKTLDWLWSGDVKQHLTNFAGEIHGSAHHSVHILHGQYLSCQVQDNICCSACNAISHQLWTCNLSGEELDYYLQTSFVCLQAAVFKLFDLNFALTLIRILQNILQVLHLLPHVQQGTPTKFVGGHVVECPVSHIW
jgi:hypothetical protein